MEIPRLSKSVVKIVELQKDSTGHISPIVLYKKTGGRKKMSAPFRPLEKAFRRVASAQAAAANKYLDRHERSNRKNKDGWVRDLVSNVVDAEKSGRKKLRIKRLVLR